MCATHFERYSRGYDMDSLVDGWYWQGTGEMYDETTIDMSAVERCPDDVIEACEQARRRGE